MTIPPNLHSHCLSFSILFFLGYPSMFLFQMNWKKKKTLIASFLKNHVGILLHLVFNLHIYLSIINIFTLLSFLTLKLVYLSFIIHTSVNSHNFPCKGLVHSAKFTYVYFNNFDCCWVGFFSLSFSN